MPITKQLNSNHETIIHSNHETITGQSRNNYIPITKQLQANQKKIDQETIINSHKIFIDRKFYEPIKRILFTNLFVPITKQLQANYENFHFKKPWGQWMLQSKQVLL